MGVRQIIGDIQDALRQLKALESGNSQFKEKRKEGLQMQLQGGMRRLVDVSRGDQTLHPLALELSQAKESDIAARLEEIAEHVMDQKEQQSYSVHFLPPDIRDVLETDLREVQSCMNAQCYRSAMIL